MSSPREKALSDAEVTAWLAENLPHWRLEDGWIRRTYKTASWKSTMMVINTVGHLAEAAWHHPDITASYAWVEVRLVTHSAKGITDKDLNLAKKIEEVVHWQPAAEGTCSRARRRISASPTSNMTDGEAAASEPALDRGPRARLEHGRQGRQYRARSSLWCAR